MNHYKKIIYVTALLNAAFHGSLSSQTLMATDVATTNTTTEVTTPVEITPVLTNQVPVLTNQVPVVKPKDTTKAGSSKLLSSFSGAFGSFSVSGRTLKLPVVEATPRSATSWRRNLDFGMNVAKGNSDILRYALGVNAVKEEGANTIRFQGHGNYGESDGSKDTENAGATSRYERKLTPRVYALGNLDWVTDPMAELDYRFTAILSPGFHLYRSPTALLNLEIGPAYVEEKKDQSETGYAAGRAAITVEKLLNEHVLSWATTEYIPKLSDTGVYFINTEIGLASYITRDLSLNVCYQNRYDSMPVETKKASDTLLSTALSLSF